MKQKSEYPRPSFYRNNWINLNGTWEFSFDHGNSGTDQKYYEYPSFDQEIMVPFCPESKLSKIHYLDFMHSVWYGKNITLTKEQLKNKIILHIDACDYQTTLYINKVKVGIHIGGFTSFEFDISEYLKEGDNRIVIHAVDEIQKGIQPRGKQSEIYYSKNCDYTRTTGIWQTIWLEFVPQIYLKNIQINATNLNGQISLTTTLNQYHENVKLMISVSYHQKLLYQQTFQIDGILSNQSFIINPVYLWNPLDPHLYDIEYHLILDNQEIDYVTSYFGIRRIDIKDNKVLINHQPVFQRLILDQGYYPDGIMTAPSDEDLIKDIQLAINLGFNGARMHQKVFEERYLYHADRLGFLLWGEFGSWGLPIHTSEALHTFLPQWVERIQQDLHHPSVICWCPYNETWNPFQDKSNIDLIYQTTKAIDSTRPVIDTSGGFHNITDIYDIHDYEQDSKLFYKHYETSLFEPFDNYESYPGNIPYMVSEYGGIKWNPNSKADDVQQSWGYGNTPKSKEEFCTRFCELTEILLNHPNISGFCYTQLTDIEQEQNGLYDDHRNKKFEDKYYQRMKQAVSKKAKIER